MLAVPQPSWAVLGRGLDETRYVHRFPGRRPHGACTPREQAAKNNTTERVCPLWFILKIIKLLFNKNTIRMSSVSAVTERELSRRVLSSSSCVPVTMCPRGLPLCTGRHVTTSQALRSTLSPHTLLRTGAPQRRGGRQPRPAPPACPAPCVGSAGIGQEPQHHPSPQFPERRPRFDGRVRPSVTALVSSPRADCERLPGQGTSCDNKGFSTRRRPVSRFLRGGSVPCTLRRLSHSTVTGWRRWRGRVFLGLTHSSGPWGHLGPADPADG